MSKTATWKKIEEDLMYFMLECFSPEDADHAQFYYEPDDDERSWSTGRRFTEPPLPVRVVIEPGESGVLPEFTDVPLPLMSRRLADCLKAIGVSNIDFYETEIHDLETNQVYRSLLCI